jgi:hypothetical protein
VATIPTVPTEAPGNFNTAALWNANILGGLNYLLAPVRFKGYASTTQSLANGTTAVPLLFDTELYDSDGGHSTTVNTSRYTVQTAGLYHVTGGATIGQTGSTTGSRTAVVMLNGANVVGSMVQAGPSPANGAGVQTSADVQAAVGDYIEIGAWQNSGAPLSTTVNGTNPGTSSFMSLYRVSS